MKHLVPSKITRERTNICISGLEEEIHDQNCAEVVQLIYTSRPKYFIHSSTAGGIAALAFSRACEPCSPFPNRPESQATQIAPPAMVTLVASLEIRGQKQTNHGTLLTNVFIHTCLSNSNMCHCCYAADALIALSYTRQRQLASQLAGQQLTKQLAFAMEN